MWDVSRNLIYAQRCQALAVAMQNIVEESERLRTVYVQELQGGDPAFVDTAIATTIEITTFQSYLSDFILFHNGGGALADTVRGVAWTLPLIDSKPA